MVTGMFHGVQSRLVISSGSKVLDSLGSTFWIHPIGIAICKETDQIKAHRQRRWKGTYRQMLWVS